MKSFIDLYSPFSFLSLIMDSTAPSPTFLMATGYEQVRSIVAHLTGDFDSARKVELDLPETGVCSINLKAKEIPHSCC